MIRVRWSLLPDPWQALNSQLTVQVFNSLEGAVRATACTCCLHVLPAVGADLNRDFPSPFMAPGCKGQAPESCNPSLLSLASNSRVQPETAAIMAWSSNDNFPFTAAANLHEGAIVTNYPWDGYLDGSRDTQGIDNPTSGEALLVFVDQGRRDVWEA